MTFGHAAGIEPNPPQLRCLGVHCHYTGHDRRQEFERNVLALETGIEPVFSSITLTLFHLNYSRNVFISAYALALRLGLEPRKCFTTGWLTATCLAIRLS